jgi:hypothetical protein
MFGFLRRKPKASLMDQFIESVYGNHPPKKTADLQSAVTLATQLLGDGFYKEDVVLIATQLNAGPMPYSTHDLAVAVALRLFKDVAPEGRDGLFEIQLMARMTVLGWMKEGKVVPALAQAFEHSLYQEYAPSPQ